MELSNKLDEVLLNTFISRKKQYKVFYHQSTVTWERIKSKSGSNSKVSVPLKDIISVTIKPTKQEKDKIDQLKISGIVSPTGSYQVHPSAPTSPALHINPTSTSFTSGIAFTFDENFFDLKEFTIHYAKICKCDSNKLGYESVTFRSNDSKIVKQWIVTLNNCLNSLNRPRNLLLFLNPYGGKKNALNIYERYAKPLFRIANIDVSVVISQRANQIRDIILRQPLTYDGIVCCGGDGTFAEIVNGLVFKKMLQIQNEINADQNIKDIPNVDIGVGLIPAGSTDTVSYCLYNTSDPKTAVLNIILGDKMGLDLASVRNEDDELIRMYTSILSYGFLGDVARESEKYRKWLGPKRYDFAGIKQFFNNRGYDIELTYLVDNKAELDSDEKCGANCSRCFKASNKSNIDDSSNENWRTIRGKYFMISAANIKCACEKSPNGISPTCHLGDGYIDLILVKHTSFFNNLRLILTLACTNKSVEQLPFVDKIRTRKFKFRALDSRDISIAGDLSNSTQTIQSGTDGKHIFSSFNCDGEVLQETSVTVTDHCQMIKVFKRQSTV